MRTIWLAADGRTVEIIDQTRLPHELVIVGLKTLEDAARAIRTMQVRGAPLIGATAAYGVALAIAEDPSDAGARCRDREARRDPPDRGQPALGAGRDAAVAVRACRRAADLPRLWRGPARSPKRMSRSTARSASTARG